MKANRIPWTIATVVLELLGGKVRITPGVSTTKRNTINAIIL